VFLKSILDVKSKLKSRKYLTTKLSTYIKQKAFIFIFFNFLKIINLKNLFLFKKKFRKLTRKKKCLVYFLAFPNHITRFKHKNSRMGKGLGRPKKIFFFNKSVKPGIILKGFNWGRGSTIRSFFATTLQKLFTVL